ncbi:MAG: alpha-amylase [Lachnospiraceae bacterium]|nr:alpha-amylase [Lachnospiraceae bacterium]MBR1817136.1 alpha-amylase [Lachnospiraceae bacterium]
MDLNGTMMQYFEWDLPADSSLWKTLKEDAAKLKTAGVTAVWLPPAYKGAAGVNDVGYGVYDLYDLGEFNQKGAVATKYGTKDEYLDAIEALHSKDINVYADIVLNHKIGADEVEEVKASEFNETSRNQMIGESKTIGAWSKFTFPGRKGKYSDFTWNWTHFDGIDWDQDRARKSLFLFKGKEWDKSVDKELDNYDYLMGADIDFDNQEVREELVRWGKWYAEFANLDGFRFDAVKHINKYFYREWLKQIEEATGKEYFAVGEYWHWNVDNLQDYIAATEGKVRLFDVPLHFNFHNCSKAHGNYDLRTIFDGTLTKINPLMAVTFVDNHDSQPGQSLESWVEDWFKPMAYALILLRQDGYPCVFYGDYKGIPTAKIKSKKRELDKLLKLRKTKAYGPQHDYFDDPNCIGWTREGDEEHKESGLAVVISDGTGGTKRMYIGKQFAGCHFSDAMGNAKYNIKIDEDGCGNFYVNRGAVAVWVQKENK